MSDTNHAEATNGIGSDFQHGGIFAGILRAEKIIVKSEDAFEKMTWADARDYAVNEEFPDDGGSEWRLPFFDEFDLAVQAGIIPRGRWYKANRVAKAGGYADLGSAVGVLALRVNYASGGAYTYYGSALTLERVRLFRTVPVETPEPEFTFAEDAVETDTGIVLPFGVAMSLYRNGFLDGFRSGRDADC